MKWTSFVLPLLIVGFAVAACGDAEEVPVPENGLTADDILDDDEGTYVGEEVLVSGEIEEILDPFGFTLEPGLLVVIDEIDDEARSRLTEGAIVQALGDVREFDRAAIEEQIGEPLDPAIYDDYQGERVIVLKRMQILVAPTVDPAGAPDLPGGADDEGAPRPPF